MDDAQQRAAAPRWTQAGRALVLGGGFGLLGDLLFYRAEIGLNAALWIGALALAGWHAHRRTRDPAGTFLLLLGVACLFAACLAWRASPVLRFWNAAAVAAAAVALAVQLRVPLHAAHLADYARGAADVAGDVVAGPMLALAEQPWPRSRRGPSRLPAVGTGVALAVPVVLVFGSLLTSADPAMEAFVQMLFDWDLESVYLHLMVLGGSAWLAAGWLRRVGMGTAGAAGRWVGPTRTLGAIELGIPLGALALLLATFIGLQARYLFGGEAFVRSTGITYAQFARRGFFELVTLCALALPVLVGAQRLVDRGAHRSVESFRALAPTIALLLGLVMLSALGRMGLYVRMYGLTEDRFYATAFMLWLGAVFGWFVVTEFRARLDRFATGAVAAGFVLLGALNAANPDATIARVNVYRAARGADLDAAYLSRLSTDAIPVLAARWAILGLDARCALWIKRDRDAARKADWRAWTWSAWRATRSARAVALSRGAARACVANARVG